MRDRAPIFGAGRCQALYIHSGMPDNGRMDRFKIYLALALASAAAFIPASFLSGGLGLALFVVAFGAAVLAFATAIPPRR